MILMWWRMSVIEGCINQASKHLTALKLIQNSIAYHSSLETMVIFEIVEGSNESVYWLTMEFVKYTCNAGHHFKQMYMQSYKLECFVFYNQWITFVWLCNEHKCKIIACFIHYTHIFYICCKDIAMMWCHTFRIFIPVYTQNWNFPFINLIWSCI